MTDAALDNRPAAGRGRIAALLHNEWQIAAIALFAVVAMQFPLIWQRSIHWDEFFHYSQVYQLADGTLTRPLQTIHYRLFTWVLEQPGSGVDHTILIRFAMFAFELLAAACVVGIAARFSDKTTGLICAAAYISGGFVFQHGFSFRSDPIATGLLMASLWLLLCTRLRLSDIVCSGMLLAAAAMVTIKAVLFAPAFAGVAWLRWSEAGKSPEWAWRLAGVGITSLCGFVLLYYWHAQGLGSESGEAAKTVVSTSASKMFLLGVPPYLIFAAKQILLAPILALMILLFPGALLRSRFSTAERIALAGLFAPVLTLFFYHNTAPYYYTFMLPPVVAASAIVVAQFREKFGSLIVASLFVITALLLWSKESSEPIRNQRALVAAADEMFPQKVAYFDFAAFLGHFPKANIFMTPWGIELYKAGIVPDMKTMMARETIPLVMDNDPMFTRLLETGEPTPEFKQADAAAVRASYIHFWGPYWIAGKEFSAGSDGLEFELFVPGPYTVRGSALTIDGVTYAEGSVVELQRGVHRLTGQRKDSRIIWGRNLGRPSAPEPKGPFWTPF